jgi:hypothetical protein
MLDRLTLKDTMDERMELLTMEVLEKAQLGGTDLHKADLKMSDLPAEIKKQFFLKASKTLLTPVGVQTVGVLNMLLHERLCGMSLKADPPDVFKFASTLRAWVWANVPEPEGYVDVTLKDYHERWTGIESILRFEVCELAVRHILDIYLTQMQLLISYI